MMLCRFLFPILSVQGSGSLPGAWVSATMCSMVFRTCFIDNTQTLHPFASVSYRASLYLSWKIISVKNGVYLSLSIQFAKSQQSRKRDMHNLHYNFTVFYYTLIYLICVHVYVHTCVCPWGDMYVEPWGIGSLLPLDVSQRLNSGFHAWRQVPSCCLFPILLLMTETARC